MKQACQKMRLPMIIAALLSILAVSNTVFPGAVYATTTATAAAAAKTSPILLIIDGKKLAATPAPILVNGKALAPARTIFETLGAKFTWDQKTQTAIGVKGQTCAILKPKDKNAVIYALKAGFSQPITAANLKHAAASSKTVALDVPAAMVNGVLMAPVSFMAESLGAAVKWDAKSRTVSITTASPFDKRMIGTWYTTESSLGMVIVKTFKSDGTFKQSLAIYSSISNYAEVTNGKFKVDGSNITYYGQTYAKANGYWKSSARPGYTTLGDIFLEGNLPAADKTEAFSFKDDNHIILDGSEFTRFNTSGTSSQASSQASPAPPTYHSAKYGFTLTFPASWKDKYVVKETGDSVQIFQKSTYTASKGEMGRLVGIAQYPADDWNKNSENITSISYDYGSVKEGSMVYYFGGPSDLQYDPDDKQAAKEYQDMEKDLPEVVKTFTPDKK